ncbi:hypothetical protein HNR00_000802 [Methylorubrum rhodinum]|uniref:Uncharacterized protein n=1 Tax=Methylorubrum rhodinum TaxID=29428 RepID=A0A840ZET6_9HYPH|nr:hypothetical protein [Methylorubrum rhodinum]MBB5756106.1 hypothetical protein [Methylorubrum rhodinum]
MAEPSPSPDRLAEVSRLAGELADQILLESMIGAPSATKVTALGEAVDLLEDCRHPIPDLVTDVLSRLHARPPLPDAPTPPAGGAPDGGLDEAEAMRGRSRFIPRFLRSLRGP